MDAAPDTGPAVSATADADLGHVPSLDGLRAVAVALVVAFHLNWRGRPVLDGGFLGVDAFFVLSGFLITTLLLQERSRHGQISLRNFYARRALRLLPAAFVLLGVVAAVHYARHPVWTGQMDGAAFLGALGYVLNWQLALRTVNAGPIAHLWSLAVEEQFYLVWPVVVALVLRRRVRPGVLFAVAASAAVASATWRTWLWLSRVEARHNGLDAYLSLTFREPFVARGGGAGAAWDRVYFASDTRADALLAGACLAIALFAASAPLRARLGALMPVALWVSAAAAIAVVLRADILDRTMPTLGMPAFALVVVLLVGGVVVAPDHPVARGLAARPLVWVGQRSYGIYLVHVPVLAMLDQSGLASPWAVAGIGVALTVAIAAASHRWFEQPILARGRRFRR